MDIADQAWSSTPTMDRRLGDVHFDDIVAARRLVARTLTPTPLVTHPLLSRRVGAEVHVKHENAVPPGSFKLRGGLAAGMGLVFKALSPHTRIIGVQSAAAPALARAWRPSSPERSLTWNMASSTPTPAA
jgi:threonine dehydratase